MTAPVKITGFEYGLETPVIAGAGLFDAIVGNPIIQNTIKRTGSYAIRLNTGGVITNLKWNMPTPQIIVGSMYYYFTSLYGASDLILWVTLSVGNRLGLRYVTTDGKIHARMVGGSDGNAADIVLQTVTWYRIDFKIDVTNNDHTIDFSVTPDGGSTYTATQTIYTQTATTISSFLFGTYSTTTTDMYVDDIIISNTGGDYPIGEHADIGRRTNADGTHNAGTNVIEDKDGNDIGVVTAYDHLSKDPFSATLGDYIKQVAVGTGSYAEVEFEDTAYSTILGVRALLQYQSSGANANEGGCIIIDEDTTETTVWGNPTTRADYSEITMFYKSKILPTPAGGWDAAAVNALKARIGYSNDVADVPYWCAVMLEVAVSGSEESGIIINLDPA